MSAAFNFNVEKYLNSLPDDINLIKINNKHITYLPDLSRFTKLEKLYCIHNYLTFLPTLPSTLKILYLDNNRLKTLPDLPPHLEYLSCADNQLSSLPDLPETLHTLCCSCNKLYSLPKLPYYLKNLYISVNKFTTLPILPLYLKGLSCASNKLIDFPNLPSSVNTLWCDNNPICEIIGNHIDDVNIIRKNAQILNKFKYLYYCIKYKKQLRKLLWSLREKKIQEHYHPMHLIELLREKDDSELDVLLEGW